MHILSVPRSVVQFCGRLGQAAADAGVTVASFVAEALPALVSTISLSCRKKTQSELARFVVSSPRHPSSVSRLLRHKEFRTRDLLRVGWQDAATSLAAEVCPRKVSWVLSLDASSMMRGAHAQIRGGQRFGKDRDAEPERTREGYRREAVQDKRLRVTALDPAATCAPAPSLATPEKKGVETQAFTMLFGMLTTHEGVRLPMTRYTCDPKGFRRPGRPKSHRDTQIDMAALMIGEVRSTLPGHVDLVVVADGFYDSEKLFSKARTPGVTLVVPTDSTRCFGRTDKPTQSNGCRIQDYGLKLAWDRFQEVTLHRGKEGTASYRRYPNRPGSGGHRTYWVHHERRPVAGLGEVGITFSWKTPVFRPKRTFAKRTFKVLLCSDPSWPPERVVEFYEMRWTMSEVGFREWKQELGLGHYVGTELEAMERHVDLVLLSFLYLELNRLELLDDTRAPEAQRTQARYARTQGMRELVWAEVQRETWQSIEEASQSERAHRRLKRLFMKSGVMLGTQACGP